jgi:hypothetical protein
MLSVPQHHPRIPQDLYLAMQALGSSTKQSDFHPCPKQLPKDVRREVEFTI